MLPVPANASIFSAFTDKVKAVFLGSQDDTNLEASTNAQTMLVFKPVLISENDTIDAIDASSSNVALSATTGALRVSTEDIDYSTNDTISVYEVKKGDTLSTVAKLYGVSKNTIMWANDLKSERLITGDTLVILPITGVKHTVKKGDTLSTIAKKYRGDVDDIAKYNGISADAKLAIDDVVIVPEGELTVTLPTVAKSSTKITKVTIASGKVLDSYGNTTPMGFLIRPVVGGVKSQGLHGHNGVDIAASIGTPVLASADGEVIAARDSGYNGGYGSMIIISHAGNIQTVYGHLSSVRVVVGQRVSQGDVIGGVGNTGKSTGPHLHVEVRGAKNPF